ncbi:protease [Endozoicomonas montiporae]|uniref:Ubiquinone biosynthesis protein UbiU n=2 Tax=Endozoicomonas montiporae TaxID=1027273 RepID=A0A081N5U6_9GAMM|nr:peptidase U32 family protein [Endozoicomonas montiporae]AMO57275.1 collagenase-like protease [Endozoicomonas montiporae CL-33]KEQ13819.1 protease [Endozoicomonas montiporae]
MELVCPAGNYPSLKAAVDNGADAVYIGFRDNTNARHFAGLNFSDQRALKALDYARDHNVRLFVAVNTYAQAGQWSRWQYAVDACADLQADALIASDMGVMAYACEKYPQLPLHLSVQGSATNVAALELYHEQFNIRRAVLPRVLSLKQVKALVQKSPVELEVFAFGSLCIMAEGRCLLSSYVAGESPNTAGACSPASAVRWEQGAGGSMETRLNDVLIDRFSSHEQAGYPTLCKGRFKVQGNVRHALEEPTSLNTLNLIPQLSEMGISAVKIEGRQRSPAYVAAVTRIWREALNAWQSNKNELQPESRWMAELSKLSEGSQTTLGAYSRPWQ